MIPLLVPDLPSTDEILPWLRQIDNNRWYSNFGPLATEFEQKIVQLLKRQHRHATHRFAMVSTCSGTTALEIGLSAYRLRPGTKVVLPSLTFPATATAVIRSGLIPVLADVDPKTWVLTPEIAESVVRKSGAKVVIPVAAFGHRLDEHRWQAFADATGCQVLIDAAGAFPSQVPIHKVDVGYSFHATKTLGIGEGGGLLSVDESYLQVARELTNFGFGKGTVETIGMNAKLSEYHAAVGLCQIERFTDIQQKRQNLYACMRQQLTALNPNLAYQSQQGPSSPTLFVVAVPKHAKFIAERLLSRGVGVRQWYCPPLHLHGAFDSYIKSHSQRFGSLQCSEQLSDRLIGLPFHPNLTTTNLKLIQQELQDSLALLEPVATSELRS